MLGAKIGHLPQPGRCAVSAHAEEPDSVAVICSLHQVDYARAYADRIISLGLGMVAL